LHVCVIIISSSIESLMVLIFLYFSGPREGVAEVGSEEDEETPEGRSGRGADEPHYTVWCSC
jgi:hypothetical protein